MEWLKEILGEELYNQMMSAIKTHNGKPENKEKQVKLGDLGKGEYVSKEKFSALEADKDSIAEQLKTAQGLIEQLKKGTGDNEALQTKITEYETKVVTLTAENEKLKVDGALKVALLDAGAKASDLDYLMFKAGTGDRDLKIGDDGKLKGQDDLIAGLKTQFPGNFAAAEQRQYQEHKLGDGGDGGAGASNEPKTLAEALKMQYENKD